MGCIFWQLHFAATIIPSRSRVILKLLQVCGTVPFTSSREVVFSQPQYPSFLPDVLTSFLKTLLSKTRQTRIHYNSIPHHSWLVRDSAMVKSSKSPSFSNSAASSEVSSIYSDCCSYTTTSSNCTFNTTRNCKSNVCNANSPEGLTRACDSSKKNSANSYDLVIH